MTGILTPVLSKGGQRGRRCLFKTRSFHGLSEDRSEANLLRRFAQAESSECFSIISVFIFEVNIVTEQKQA